MATLKYERVVDPESAAVVDQVSVYNPEQIDDTTLIIRNNSGFDQNYAESIGFREIFNDSRLSPLQRRICFATVISAACITLVILISLFANFGKVLLDVVAYEERSNHGLTMVPILRSRSVNMLYYDFFNKSSNLEYANEISDYLMKYHNYRESVWNFENGCTAQEKLMDTAWCIPNPEYLFDSECSNSTGYGYLIGKPCLIFAFKDRLGWRPNVPSNVTHLPFLCRMQYQYSSSIYPNITYYPHLSSLPMIGAFDLTMLPSRIAKDSHGDPILQNNREQIFSPPPLLMVKLSFPDFKKERPKVGPFTLDCRINDNVSGYEFANLKDFNGQTWISFDFMPKGL